MTCMCKGVVMNHSIIRWVPLERKELPTRLKHLNSPPGFSGIRVTQSLVL